jgi:hypothetical protein
VGDSAITCKHCVGSAEAFRYFPTSETALARGYCLEQIVHHLLDCSHCPSAVKDRIRPIKHEKFRSRNEQTKEFFQRCWERIERIKDNQADGSTEKDPVDTDDFAEQKQVAESEEEAKSESAPDPKVDAAQMEPSPRLAEDKRFPVVVPREVTAPPVGAPDPEVPLESSGFTSIAERAKRRTTKRHDPTSAESDDDSKPLASLKKSDDDAKMAPSSPPVKLSANYTSEDEKPLATLKRQQKEEDKDGEEEESDKSSSDDNKE